MKRIQYHRYGGPEELHLEEVPLPTPRADEIRVRVKAAGANPMDWGIRKGVVKMLSGSRFPRGLGHDFAGVVDAVGPSIERFKVGDEVFGATDLRTAGTFAEVLIAKEEFVFSKPALLPFEQAGAMTIAGATAIAALVGKAKIRSGQSVFVSGCLGALGRAAVQIAIDRGAIVTGSCSEDKQDDALALGVSEAFDYRAFEPSSCRGRFDVVLDAAGALSAADCEVMLKPKGVALHVTNVLSNMLRFLFSSRHHAIIGRLTPKTRLDFVSAAYRGKLHVAVGATVPLSEAIAAIVRLENTGLPKGKLVVLP